MDKTTALYCSHKELGAKMFSFSGWLMPMSYGSQIKEHQIVRSKVGMFDVSHMQLIDIKGKEAKLFLQYLLANDIGKLTHPNKALYSCLLNETGGIIDDLIVYHCDLNHYCCVVNAAKCSQDLDWFKKKSSSFNVKIKLKQGYSILAVQGPQAINTIKKVLPIACGKRLDGLKKFCFFEYDNYFISSTGYTGEDGVELILREDHLLNLWDKLIALNVQPCGLGARDTLRLEAGFNLSGTDMDETVTPYESNLGWTLSMTKEREFIGKQALLLKKNELTTTRLVGLVLKEKGILRNNQLVKTIEGKQGIITSGSYSPTLHQAIALARIPSTQAGHCWVNLRNHWKECLIVSPPFIKNNKPNFNFL